jgi:hypothetical protein
MGLLDNSGDILIDAVLTDVGREFLSRNDGSFEVVRFALGDDEVDYTLFNANTGSLQQDTSVLNTPIFEASVNEKAAVRSQLLSISNPDLRYLPKLQASVSAVSLSERNDAQIGKTLEFSQTTTSGKTVPSEVVDGSFLIQLNNDLLFVERQTPVNVTQYGTAQYVLAKTATGANQGSQVSFNVAVQALSSDLWTILGVGAVGTRTITTKVKAQGTLSGLSAEATITITEGFSR